MSGTMAEEATGGAGRSLSLVRQRLHYPVLGTSQIRQPEPLTYREMTRSLRWTIPVCSFQYGNDMPGNSQNARTHWKCYYFYCHLFPTLLFVFILKYN